MAGKGQVVGIINFLQTFEFCGFFVLVTGMRAERGGGYVSVPETCGGDVGRGGGGLVNLFQLTTLERGRLGCFSISIDNP